MKNFNVLLLTDSVAAAKGAPLDECCTWVKDIPADAPRAAIEEAVRRTGGTGEYIDHNERAVRA